MSRSIKGMIGGHIFSEGKKDVDQTCGLFNATVSLLRRQRWEWLPGKIIAFWPKVGGESFIVEHFCFISGLWFLNWLNPPGSALPPVGGVE